MFSNAQKNVPYELKSWFLVLGLLGIWCFNSVAQERQTLGNGLGPPFPHHSCILHEGLCDHPSGQTLPTPFSGHALGPGVCT